MQKKINAAKKFSISKKSTFFNQSLYDLVKITSSWVGKIAWISTRLDENCGFLILAKFWARQFFLHQSLVLRSSSSSYATGCKKINDFWERNWKFIKKGKWLPKYTNTYYQKSLESNILSLELNSELTL